MATAAADGPAVWEGKKYKLIKSENFDEYMKALGVGLVLRKLGNSTSPVVELTQKDDTYTLTTTSTFKSNVLKFKLEKEFDEVTLDGRKVKSIITLHDNKLIQEQKGDMPTTIIREFTENQLITTLILGEFKSVRTYDAVV